MNDRFYDWFEKVMYVVVIVLAVSFVVVCFDQSVQNIDRTKCVWDDSAMYEILDKPKPLNEVIDEFKNY